jgi:hypothetical protein
LAPKCWLKFGVPVVVLMEVHRQAVVAAAIRKLRSQFNPLVNHLQ